MAVLVTLAGFVPQQRALGEAEFDTTIVIDLTGGVNHPRRVTRTLHRRTGTPVAIRPPERRLIDAYRWSRDDPAQATCDIIRKEIVDDMVRGNWVTAPLGQASLFEPLVSQAEEQLAFLDLAGVLDTAQSLRSWAPCEHKVVQHETIARLWLTVALAHLYQGDDAGVTDLMQLLSVEPRFHPSEETATPQVTKAFAEAMTRFARLSPVPLPPSLGASVVADGRRLDRLVLYPGLHLIQLKAPHGEIRSRFVKVGTDGKGRSPRMARTFGLLTREQAYRALVRDVASRSFDERASTILEDYLSHLGQGTLLFLVGPPTSPQLVQFAPRVGSQPWSSREASGPVVTANPHATSRASSRWLVSAGAGLQELAGGTAFVAVGLAGGYTLSLAREGAVLDLRLSGGAYPHPMGSTPLGDSCVPEGNPHELDIASAAQCLDRRPIAILSLAVGHGWYASQGRRVRISPGVAIDILRVPNVVVVPEGTGDASPLVGDAIMGGGTIRLHVAYSLSDGPHSPQVAISADFGIVAARAPETTVLGTLFGTALWAVFPF